MSGLRRLLFHPANLPRTAVAAILILFVLLFPVTRPEDPDVWFHLSAGRHLWTQGEYPGMDTFLYTWPAGEPGHHHEWLFQALIFPLYRLAGMKALVLVKSLLIAAAFLPLFLTSLSRKIFYPALMYFLVAFGAASGRFYIKPEIAGALALALMWLLISRRPAGPRIFAAVVVLQVLWTNLHWSSILGVAVTGSFAAADTVGRFLPLPPRWRSGTEGTGRLYFPLLFLAVLLGTLANPDGLRPLTEPFRYFIGQEFLLPVAELWPSHLALFRGEGASFQLFFFIALGAGVASFLAGAGRINLAHLFTFCGLALLSLSSERHILFFSLLATPIVAANLARLLPDRPGSHLYETAAALAGAFIITTLTMNKVTGIPFLLPYPRPYEPLSAGDSEILWPHKAAALVTGEGLPDRIFNNFNSGNYLNWAVYPRRIFINGTFSDRKTEEEYARLRTHPEEWGSFAEARGIETAFFRLTPLIAPRGLVAAAVRDHRWKMVFYDGTAVVLVRDAPRNSRIIDRHPVSLERELQEAVRDILSNGRDLPGGKIPLWREIAQHRGRQDLARLFRLRGQFYLLMGRTDLAAIALEMVKNLEG